MITVKQPDGTTLAKIPLTTGRAYKMVCGTCSFTVSAQTGNALVEAAVDHENWQHRMTEEERHVQG
jgi:hypothetical protein